MNFDESIELSKMVPLDKFGRPPKIEALKNIQII